MGNLQVKIGELLRLERERQGIKLEDISTNLKITIANLESVEKGDVDSLPSELYFGLFAKSYSEAIGIDYTATVDAIREELAALPEEPVDTKKKKTAQPDSPVEDEQDLPNEPDDAQSNNSVFKQKKILYSIVAVVIIVGGYLVVAQLLKDMSTGDQESSTEGIKVDNRSEASSDSPYDNYDWNVPAYKKPEPFTLSMTARAESWSTVIADGDTAIFRRLVPGRQYTATARYRMFLSVAVPSKVDIKLNGKKIDPVSPETKRISRVLIDQTNIDSILTAKDKTTISESQTVITKAEDSLEVSLVDQQINNSDVTEELGDER